MERVLLLYLGQNLGEHMHPLHPQVPPSLYKSVSGSSSRFKAGFTWAWWCHSILPRPLWLLRAKLLLSFSSLDSSRQEDYDRWYYFLVEKLRSKQKLLPVFCLLCFFWTKSPVLSLNFCFGPFGKNQNLYSQKTCEIATVTFLCSSIVYVWSEQTKLYQNFKREKLEIFFKCYFVFWFLKTDWSDWVSVLVSVMQWFKQLSKSTCKLRL